jgi:hypothetical protein
MSTVKKTVFLNPIEPAPLSFRAGAYVDTFLEVTYYAQTGYAYASDVDGQLMLTNRSSGTRKAYSMPAIDVANGKARAIIPAGDITDINGYSLALYGSVAGEAGLIARGLVWPDDQEEPLPDPVDVIDTVPIELFRSQPTDSAFTVKLWDDESKSDPYEIGGATVSAAVLIGQGGLKLTDFTAAPVSGNSVQLSLTQAQVTVLPDSCWWVLQIGSIDGVTTLCEGPVTVHA